MVVDDYQRMFEQRGGLKERTVHFLAGSKPADVETTSVPAAGSSEQEPASDER